MSKILCIETSTEVCSVAIVENGIVLDLMEDASGMNHSKLLTVFIQQMLEKNDLKASDLSAVAVSKGPGSYTGLRIGVSAAKGICYGVNIPLIAVSSLEAMADELIFNTSKYGVEIQNDDRIVPMIDARRMEVYACVLNANGALLKPVEAIVIDEGSFSDDLNNNRLIFIGNGAPKCNVVLAGVNVLFVDGVITSATNMARIVQQKFDNADFVDVAYFEPFYLKNFVATKPKNSVLDRI